MSMEKSDQGRIDEANRIAKNLKLNEIYVPAEYKDCDHCIQGTQKMLLYMAASINKKLRFLTYTLSSVAVISAAIFSLTAVSQYNTIRTTASEEGISAGICTTFKLVEKEINISQILEDSDQIQSESENSSESVARRFFEKVKKNLPTHVPISQDFAINC